MKTAVKYSGGINFHFHERDRKILQNISLLISMLHILEFQIVIILMIIIIKNLIKILQFCTYNFTTCATIFYDHSLK